MKIECHKQLYVYKSAKLDKIDQFLKHYKLLKFTQDKIYDLNAVITIKEIELVKTFIKDSPYIHDFAGEFYQTFRK